jgi:hypothetical protein
MGNYCAGLPVLITSPSDITRIVLLLAISIDDPEDYGTLDSVSRLVQHHIPRHKYARAEGTGRGTTDSGTRPEQRGDAVGTRGEDSHQVRVQPSAERVRELS